MESSDTPNQTETEIQESTSSSSSTNQSDSTTLASSNSANAPETTANATNAINITDARLDGRIVFAKAPTGDVPFSTRYAS